MPEFTFAYLEDGRYAKVHRSHSDEWREEVNSGATTLGLAQWFAFDPDTGELLDDIELHGVANTAPQCDHHDEQNIRVTNAAQIREYNPEAPIASTWVCSKRPCVLAAAAWVERDTGDEARFTADRGHTWHSLSLPFI